jgi:hypothetical protein
MVTLITLSTQTWEFWCKKNDVLFVPFEEPVEQDLHEYRINWQKAIFVFDELERRGIEYDQIALVDSTVMVKWDCPNFFELTDRKFTVTRDIDNMSWTRDSIIGYKDFFGGFELDSTKYFRSGFMIFNEIHRDLFQDLKNFYIENKSDFIKLQDEVVRKGNDQTPINYWVQKNNIDLKFLPQALWMCSHLHRKEMLSHNWQLDEDTTPFFIKYANNWMFNGIPKDQRTSLMSQTWEFVKNNYTLDDTEFLLNSVNHKDTFKNATSRKFKKDLIEYFSEDKYKEMTMVELGACHGDTTKIFSKIFKKVHAVDWKQSNLDLAKKRCEGSNNITYQVSNVATDAWDYPKCDVVFIDASHDYPQILLDIEKTLNYFDNPIIILDDHGNPNNMSIRKAIDELVDTNKLKIQKYIGEESGFKTKSGWCMNDREGVICTI